MVSRSELRSVSLMDLAYEKAWLKVSRSGWHLGWRLALLTVWLTEWLTELHSVCVMVFLPHRLLPQPWQSQSGNIPCRFHG